MDMMSVFWVFFMMSALQPVIKQKLLESARQKLIASLEKKRGSRVILLVHRQETMSLLGFPVLRYINVEDSEHFTGAGLYDSYSGCLMDDLDGDSTGPSQCDPAEPQERGVFRAIHKVYASF